MKKTVTFTIIAWLLLIAASFSWNHMNARKEQKRITLQTARTLFKQVILTREWNANHGGVYAPVTEDTQPNPYLKDPLRDLQVNGNLKLTKLNPAFMTRQLSELSAKQQGVQFRITSLRPIRPMNRATERETSALRAFEKGVKEVGEFVKSESDVSFFYMAPLKTKKSCLQCHAEQGYKEGDIRGGISVSLPIIPKLQLLPIALGHTGIGLVGIVLIAVFGIKLDAAYRALRQQAVIDSLTMIPNRRHFTERFLEEFQRCKREENPLSLIMCDIDYFKAYNDTYGHNLGDDCLKQVARTIEAMLRRPGDFCARYGGEEFVVILPNTTQQGALYIAEELRSSVEKQKIPHEGSPNRDFVTISLGLATDCLDSKGPDELIKRADKALYRAKANGRNRVELYSENVAV